MVTDEMLKRAIEAYAKETGAEDWQLDGWINSAIRAALEAALSAAEQQTAPSVAEEIADAVLSWMVRYDLLDAGNEYRAADVIAVLDDFKPSYHAALSAQVQDDVDIAAAIDLGAAVLSKISDPAAREIAIRNALIAASSRSGQVQDVAGYEAERLRRMVEHRDEFIIGNGLWDAFKEAAHGRN